MHVALVTESCHIYCDQQQKLTIEKHVHTRTRHEALMKKSCQIYGRLKMAPRHSKKDTRMASAYSAAFQQPKYALTSTKEPCISTQEPCISIKEPYASRTRTLYIHKRALYMHKRTVPIQNKSLIKKELHASAQEVIVRKRVPWGGYD